MRSQRFIRMLACLLTLAMLFSVLPAAAFADEAVEEESPAFGEVLDEEKKEDPREEGSGEEKNPEEQDNFPKENPEESEEDQQDNDGEKDENTKDTENQPEKDNEQDVTTVEVEENKASDAFTQVAIDETNFPDKVFRQYVADNFDTDKNEYLNESEIEAIKTIDVSYNPYLSQDNKYEQVNTLKGLEFFPNLEELKCFGNNLTELDVKENTKLKKLECGAVLSVDIGLTLLNNLTSLNLSNNTELNYLDCSHNQIASLDLSNNTKLSTLRCSFNELTTLDVSKNKELNFLLCENNQLTSLDISNNAKLNTLICSNNQLNSLDTSSNTSLYSLNCGGNHLTTLDSNLSIVSGTGNTYTASLAEDGTFDLSTIPNFKPSRLNYVEGGVSSGSVVVKPISNNIKYSYFCNDKNNSTIEVTVTFDNYYDILHKNGNWTKETFSGDLDVAVYNSNNQVIARAQNGYVLQTVPASQSGVSLVYNNGVIELSRLTDADTHIIVTGTGSGAMTYTNGDSASFSNIVMEPGKMLLIEGVNADDAKLYVYVLDEGINDYDKTHTVDNDGTETPIVAPVITPDIREEYEYNNSGDIFSHKSYPTGMTVYFDYPDGTKEEITELRNLLTYKGTSVRLSDPKGIRIITLVDANLRDSLINDGIKGYKMVEYGTAVISKSKYDETKKFELGADGVNSGYAYNKDADYNAVFSNSDGALQYTNNLVGWSNNQCGQDLLLRSYAKFKNDAGDEIIVYGGILNRSISYIAEQNLSAYSDGSDEYNFLKTLAELAQ